MISRMLMFMMFPSNAKHVILRRLGSKSPCSPCQVCFSPCGEYVFCGDSEREINVREPQVRQSLSPLLGIPCHSKGLPVTSLSLPENHCKQKLRGSRIILYIYDIIRSSYIINSESSQIFGMFYFLRSPSSVRVFRSSKPTRWTSSRPKFSRNNSDASPQGAPRNRVQKLWRLRWPHMN